MGDTVFVNGMAAVHAGSSGKSIAFPDVCLCPPTPPAGPVPTPLPNNIKAADLDAGASSVLVEGNPMGKKSSNFKLSTGNEVSRPTGGGVVTHGVQGKGYFASFAVNVMIEGEPAVRHLDMVTHNHMGPQPPNTPPAPWLATMDVPAPPPDSSVKDAAEALEKIEIRLFDENDLPVDPTPYRLTTPSGQTIEGRVLSSATLKVIGLTKGNCRLVLPRSDERCREARRTDSPPTKGAQVGYKPGAPLSLATGKVHEVVVPGMLSFWVDLPLDTRDLATRDDRFVLSSDDGAYKVARTIKDDRVRGDGMLTLEFPALKKGQTYSLTHEPGAEDSPVKIFTDRPFDDLYKPPPLDDALAPPSTEEE